MNLKKRMIHSFKEFIKNWKIHPVLYIMDIIFIILSFFVFLTVQIRIATKVGEMSDLLAQQMDKITATSSLSPELINPNGLQQLLTSNPDISKLFTEVILLFLGLITILFLLWCFFQGINWTVTHHLIKKMESPAKYFLRFIGINLVWFLFLFILIYLWFNLSLYNMRSFIPVFPQFILNVIAVIFIIIITYFMIISFVLAKKKKTFKTIGYAFMHGTKYVLDMLAMFIVMMGSLFVVVLIVWFVFPLSLWLTVFILLVVFIPLLSLLRFFAVLSIEDIVKKED